MAVSDFHMPPAFERSEHHEEIGHAVALVFVIETRWPSFLHRNRRADFVDQLLGRFIEADERIILMARPFVDVQHVLHRRYEGRACLGRNDPLLLEMRLESFF